MRTSAHAAELRILNSGAAVNQCAIPGWRARAGRECPLPRKLLAPILVCVPWAFRRHTRIGLQTAGLAGLSLLLALAGCSLPGRLYDVTPPLSGWIQSNGSPLAGDRVVLAVHLRDTATLFGRVETQLDEEGRFRFDPIALSVFGHEHNARYRAFLYMADDDSERIVWRGEYSRMEIGLPVELRCDLDRPPSHGQPCRVIRPTSHPWLVSAGQRSFRQLCQSCHGKGGRGDGPVAAALIEAPPDLTRIARRRGGDFPRAEIAQWIEGRSAPAAHGSREMPIWGVRLAEEYRQYQTGEDLVGAQMDALVTYLETLQAPTGN